MKNQEQGGKSTSRAPVEKKVTYEKAERAGSILTYLLVDSFLRLRTKWSLAVWLRISLYPGEGHRDKNVVHSPILPTAGQLSLTSSWAAPALCRSDSNRKGSHTAQVSEVSQWQSRKSHWGRNSGLLWEDWQTTPTLGQHLEGPALLGFWSMNQKRSFFRRLHTILISKCVSLNKNLPWFSPA